ncbi:MAG: relaxase/mobilization nuclease domain-containing protein [Ruminococcus sp.]|nr:relaxase/mobilization nuclease domain-containing protein [Ruminococcus sp.]
MAIVKFVAAKCPMSYIFKYVMRKEATERKLIDGVNCSPASAMQEFIYTKQQFNKEDGRQYYHIVQSFSPDDKVTPEMAHQIGMEFAACFSGYQILVATHVNTKAVHNHLIMNSVNFENGKKFHITRDQMLEYKRMSNGICHKYGLSITEPKTKKKQRWKDELVYMIYDALRSSATKEDFVEFLQYHGYDVKREDKYKYITFTTPEGIKVRDNKLFDECLLKDNLELYFLMGGCYGELAGDYLDYETPDHPEAATMTLSTGLVEMMGDIFSMIKDEPGYTPPRLNEISQAKKARIEKILGRKITNEAYLTYCTREDYEQQAGLRM